MEQAIFGFIGVVVGAMLAFHLNRRNWQLQKAAEAFAAMYEAGSGEITRIAFMTMLVEVGDAQQGEAALTPFCRELGENPVSDFLRRIMQYYLFERDPGLRSRVDALKQRFIAYRFHAIKVAQLVIRSGKAEGNDFAYKGVLARLEKVEGNYTGPSGTELLSELESLAESVGKKYFWASDSSRNPEILGAGPRPESVNPQSAIRNPQ